MLLAVEGGRFFSSSAVGYSKGLNLLLLGQKNEEKPMRVTPWNQYQLVDQEPDPDLRLASGSNRLVCGCASLFCCGRATAGPESPLPQKEGSTKQQDVLKSSVDSEKVKENINTTDHLDDDTVNGANVSNLRSSLKTLATTVLVPDAVNNESEGELVHENGDNDHGQTGRRVQWTDVSGGELFEIREFEPSEHSGSGDEFDNGNERTCSCSIM